MNPATKPDSDPGHAPGQRTLISRLAELVLWGLFPFALLVVVALISIALGIQEPFLPTLFAFGGILVVGICFLVWPRRRLGIGRKRATLLVILGFMVSTPMVYMASLTPAQRAEMQARTEEREAAAREAAAREDAAREAARREASATVEREPEATPTPLPAIPSTTTVETQTGGLVWRSTPWPITETAFTLSCERTQSPVGPVDRVFITLDDDRRFAVNGLAGSRAPAFDPVQAHHDAGPLIDRGLALCNQGKRSQRYIRRQISPPIPTPTAAPHWTIAPENPAPRQSLDVEVQSEEVLAGQRLRLTFSCYRDGAFPFHVHLRAPPRGMSNIGLVASFDFGTAGSHPLPIAWALNDSFIVRDDRIDIRARVLRPWFQSGVLTITPPEQFVVPGTYSFRVDRLTAPQRELLRRNCQL